MGPARGLRALGVDRGRRLDADPGHHGARGLDVASGAGGHLGAYADLAAVPALDLDPAVGLRVDADARGGGQDRFPDLAVALVVVVVPVAVAIPVAPPVVRYRVELGVGGHGLKRRGQAGQQGEP